MIGIALAVGIGVQTGESAIRSINPILLQGPAPPPRAIDPNAPPASDPAGYADAYGWAAGDAARQADSGLPAEAFDYAPPPPVRPAAEPTWQEQPAPVSLAPWRPGQVSAHPQIDRYADFAIEEKPTPHIQPDRSAEDQPAAESPAPEADKAPPAP